MNFLITGGAGSVGRDLTASLLEKGHSVRVLDKHAEAFGPAHDGNLELIRGRHRRRIWETDSRAHY